MKNFRTREISLLYFACILSTTIACYDFCFIDQKINNNILLYEELAKKSLKNKTIKAEEYSDTFQSKVLYSAENNFTEVCNDQDEYKDIKQMCAKLGIISIMVNENNNILLFFPYRSNFFKGELIEEFIEVIEQDNNVWSDFEKESSERQVLCEIKLSNKSRYVKIRSSN